MMKGIFRTVALMLAFLMLFSSCTKEEIVSETDTEKASTEAEISGTKATETTTEDAPLPHPGEDDVLNILMIGNSFSYYYPDELYGIAKAAGIKMRICNVYYSGCTLKQHWEWWRTRQKNYQFFTYDEKGRVKQEKVGLTDCISQGNWDVISLQDGNKNYRNGGLDGAISATEPYMKALLDFLNEEFPHAVKLWHQTWAFQIGYTHNSSGMTIQNEQQQDKMAQDLKTVADTICQKYQIGRVPSGSAWQYARADSRVGDGLCKSDLYHEGEEGGGQYLNACVWFEVLTGKSCLGNSYRPNSYSLSSDRIQGLQEAAHRAVADFYGADWAK